MTDQELKDLATECGALVKPHPKDDSITLVTFTLDELREFTQPKTCSTCKHWEPFQNDEYAAWRGAGTCHKVIHVDKVTELKEDADDDLLDFRELKPEHAGVLAAVQDGSGYKATLMTMPGFGCPLHETKSP